MAWAWLNYAVIFVGGLVCGGAAHDPGPFVETADPLLVVVVTSLISVLTVAVGHTLDVAAEERKAEQGRFHGWADGMFGD